MTDSSSDPAESASKITRELDTRGLNCPLPILRAKKTLNGMNAGEVLGIVSTDPGSVKDFRGVRSADRQCVAGVIRGQRRVSFQSKESLTRRWS